MRRWSHAATHEEQVGQTIGCLTVLGIIVAQCRNPLPEGAPSKPGSVSDSACFRVLTEPRP
jgi:hypothetical protein